MTTTLTTEQLLAIPLEELRERVSLAERLALAARLTPTGQYALADPVVQPQGQDAAAAATATRKRRTKAEIEADEKAAAAAAAASAPKTTEAAADELELSLDDNTASASAGDGADLSLDDDEFNMLGDGGDATPSLEEMRAQIVKIATEIRDAQDKNRLTAVKALMQKYGVQRVTEVGDDKLADFFKEFVKV